MYSRASLPKLTGLADWWGMGQGRVPCKQQVRPLMSAAPFAQAVYMHVLHSHKFSFAHSHTPATHTSGAEHLPATCVARFKMGHIWYQVVTLELRTPVLEN